MNTQPPNSPTPPSSEGRSWKALTDILKYSRNIVIKLGLTPSGLPCPICGKRTHKYSVGYFLEGTEARICHDCARERDPDLYWRMAPYFGLVDDWQFCDHMRDEEVKRPRFNPAAHHKQHIDEMNACEMIISEAVDED